jgi:hypothetical protein
MVWAEFAWRAWPSWVHTTIIIASLPFIIWFLRPFLTIGTEGEWEVRARERRLRAAEMDPLAKHRANEHERTGA